MCKIYGRLSVYFDSPFWIGVFERYENNLLSVAKVTFGSEPRDYEVYDFILKNYDRLQFSPGVTDKRRDLKRINPKRLQRQIQREVLQPGRSTKSQLALSLQHEKLKTERKEKSRKKRQEEKEEQYQKHQQKKKDRHKGK